MPGATAALGAPSYPARVWPPGHTRMRLLDRSTRPPLANGPARRGTSKGAPLNAGRCSHARRKPIHGAQHPRLAPHAAAQGATPASWAQA